MHSLVRKFSRRVLAPARCLSAEVTAAPHEQYDMVINGGGIVGAALALRMAKSSGGGLRIALLEQGKIPSLPPADAAPDIRTYALSPKSIQLLQSLDAWKYIEPRSFPYRNMQIWEAQGPGVVKFRATELEVEELGRICEDRCIAAALYQSIKDNQLQVDVIHGDNLSQFQLPDAPKGGSSTSFVDLTLSSGRRLVTRLLVGADGGNSFVRTQAGIQSFGWTYGQQAVVGTVKLELSTATGWMQETLRHTAWQRYLSTGPLAVLPLWNGYASIVWSLPTREAKRVKALSDAQWIQELNAALEAGDRRNTEQGDTAQASNFPPIASLLWSTVVRREVKAVMDAAVTAAQLQDPLLLPPVILESCSPRMSFPLQLQQAASYAQPRLALVGDAAHSIHPQAGQGLNLGLQDVACLASHLEQELATGADFGASPALADYHRERFRENLAMLAAVDTIHRVFSTPEASGSGVISSFLQNRFLSDAKHAVKSIGMLGLNTVGRPVKNEMAKVAMGLK